MGETYQFFRKAFDFQGKHAQMVSELWEKNEYIFFKRLIDIYIVAPVIGFRMNRKAAPDYSVVDSKTIFPEQMIKESHKLEFIMQMILMLEEDELSDKERVRRAFRSVEIKEDFDAYNRLFNDYVRGGVEILYEKLVVQKPEVDSEYREERTANIMGLIEYFRR